MARCQIFIVLGVTGVGKSTFIKYATGLDVSVGHSQKPCTADTQLYQMPDSDVYFLDTPGFDDPNITDAKILEKITEVLVDAFCDNYDIKGAIYVHAVIEAKIRGSGMQNLIMFRKMMGANAMPHCRLVTTKWSLQDKSVSEAREKELCEKEEFWQPLLARGAQTVRFGDSTKSAIDIIRPLVYGEPFKPKIVSEVVDDHKKIRETEAGQKVNDDVNEAKKAASVEIAGLKAEIKIAMDAKDDEYRAILLEQEKKYKDQLRELEEAQRVLDRPIPARSSGRVGRWIARGCAALVGTVMTIGSGGVLAPAAALLYGATETGAQVHKHY